MGCMRCQRGDWLREDRTSTGFVRISSSEWMTGPMHGGPPRQPRLAPVGCLWQGTAFPAPCRQLTEEMDVEPMPTGALNSMLADGRERGGPVGHGRRDAHERRGALPRGMPANQRARTPSAGAGINRLG
jgi:hypothetical protein